MLIHTAAFLQAVNRNTVLVESSAELVGFEGWGNPLRPLLLSLLLPLLLARLASVSASKDENLTLVMSCGYFCLG